MNKMLRTALGLAMMAASSEDHFRRGPIINNPAGLNPKPIKSVLKEEREFTIKGQKVMAYSKKDAIKRFNHIRSND